MIGKFCDGYIPGVFLAVGKAIYQGLHLGKAQLRGENIRLNIGQVLQGKTPKNFGTYSG
jgi:hypothetical protein